MKIDTVTLMIFDIPPYLFLSGVGFIISVSFYFLLLLKENISLKTNFDLIYLSLIGMFFGAKLFGIIKNSINEMFVGNSFTFTTITHSGIVYYGGLLGFLIIYHIRLKYKLKSKMIDNEQRNRLYDCIALCIPLFHIFGRIGCFCAGCCYGIETKSHFAVYYTNYIGDNIVTLSRFPIQILESFINLIIFVILLVFFVKGVFRNKLLNLYLFFYPLSRFVMEFYRGDWDRRIAHGFSMSQFVSFIIIIINLVTFNRNNKGEMSYDYNNY